MGKIHYEWSVHKVKGQFELNIAVKTKVVHLGWKLKIPRHFLWLNVYKKEETG